MSTNPGKNFTKGLASVIIPTYNRAALLREAVHSILNQTYRPVECIVVDDGSTDNTAEVMQELQKETTVALSIQYIVQPNAGAQVARNKGTAMSTGEFVQYLDSDDLLYPDKLEKQIAYLNQHPECDGVYGDWHKGTTKQYELNKAYASEDMVYQLLIEKSIANFSFLMRKKLVSAIGDWDVSIKRNQEIDFQLRGLMYGAVYHYQEQVTGLWRTHEGERIFSKTNFSSAIYFYKKWEKILQEKKIWNSKFQEGIVRNYMWFLNTYPESELNEMNRLLKEVYRLNPQHFIFATSKFKLVKNFFGLNNAINMWIYRFRLNQKR
jgi:glycosyltransferase involved in cell wall biosynthesis